MTVTRVQFLKGHCYYEIIYKYLQIVLYAV